MLNIVVCAILLAAVCCVQQEHLTCLRTDDVLNQQSSQSSKQAIRGSPGKRGAKGEIGLRGDPGQKGEPGILDNHQLTLLRNQLNSFSQELNTIKNQSEKNQQNNQLNYLLQEVGALKNQSKINGKLTNKKECGTSCSHQINLLRDELKSLSRDVEALKNQTHKIQQQGQINLLRDELKSLSRDVEALKNQTHKVQQQGQINLRSQEAEAPGNQTHKIQQQGQINLRSQEAEAPGNQSNKYRNTTVPTNGLYLPPHVYIYKVTARWVSWQASQKLCRNWGGNLAVHGVKTLENRRKLIRILSIYRSYYWIGANDIRSEGNWVWINGERASSSELSWGNRQPDNVGGNEDCLLMNAYPTFLFGLAFDDSCADNWRGLCEKKL